MLKENNNNDTTIFLLPIMLPHIKYDELYSNDFLQAYIGLEFKHDFDDTLILVFNDMLPDLVKFIDLNILGDGQKEEESEFFISFEIPDELKQEYDKFLNGEYHMFSEENKEIILNFWEEDDKDSLLYKTLYNITKKNIWNPPDILGKELY